jgi:hypothetical protein
MPMHPIMLAAVFAAMVGFIIMLRLRRTRRKGD